MDSPQPDWHHGSLFAVAVAVAVVDSASWQQQPRLHDGKLLVTPWHNHHLSWVWKDDS